MGERTFALLPFALMLLMLWLARALVGACQGSGPNRREGLQSFEPGPRHFDEDPACAEPVGHGMSSRDSLTRGRRAGTG